MASSFEFKPFRPLHFSALIVCVALLGVSVAMAAGKTGSASSPEQASHQGDWRLSIKGKPVQGALLMGQTPPGAQVVVDGTAIPVSEHGHFLLGIGRFDTQPIQLEITTGSADYQLTIPIIKRDFPTEVVDGLPPAKVNPPKAVLDRIRREGALIAKARAVVEPREDFLMPFIWPASGRVSGVYGSRRILNGQPKRPHYGMDIANKTGTPVVAPADGVVRLAEPDLYYSGGTIIIDHGLGLTSTYLHLSQLNVRPGQKVHQGEKIGEIGATGRASGPHLDWRLNLGKKRLDPQLILN